jgi:predicted nucleic acid-binding protein
MKVIADTSFVVAVTISTDSNHQRCLSIWRQQNLIYLPQSTLAELMYLITKAVGNRAAARFLTGLPKSKYRLITLEEADIARTADILLKYADSRVDFVDASIIAIAERLNITRILTLDQRDFALVRPLHADRFDLLPA